MERVMKEKKTPQRMCIACREMHDKNDLIRIVKSPEGVISLDFTGKKNGRGAYVCAKKECIEKVKKGKMLSRNFKMAVEDSVYDDLIKEFEIAKR
jgi:predicted RNA-binding protein YlxR (DUF448 family)